MFIAIAPPQIPTPLGVKCVSTAYGTPNGVPGPHLSNAAINIELLTKFPAKKFRMPKLDDKLKLIGLQTVFAQNPMQDLSDRRFGQTLSDFDVAWYLELR